jgi:Regulator of ribonuclease activity B
LKSPLVQLAVLVVSVAVVAVVAGAIVGRAIANDRAAAGFHVIRTVPDGPAGDLVVIDALRKAGSNLSRRTEITYYLYVPAERDAREAAALLKKHNLAATVEKPLGVLEDGSVSDAWGVITVTNDVPSLETVRTAGALFEDLARKYDGQYDGWEAAVQK